jgi:Peptidase family M49
MKYAHVLTAIVAGSLMACSSTDQAGPSAATSSPGAAAAGLPSVDVEAALRSVAPDLDQRIARFKPVSMAFDAGKLTDRERQMVDQLVIACRYLESMYWRQSDPEGLALYKALEKVDTPAGLNLRRYLLINGSRWDLVEENAPFVGTTPMPPGHALYPADLTRAALEAYVAAHPDKKAEVYNPYTIVHGQGAGDTLVLSGRAYHDEFKPFVEGAAGALRKAASLSDDPAFAKFLQLRADALFTDDYYASDIAWIDLQNPKFDVIFAPYETYLDNLLGVKTSYGAAILVRNEAESQNLAKYQKWLPDLQDSLPLAAADRPSVKGHVTPMEVMDAPFRAGDLRHGYQAVADNLPNDPRIHQEKGTKKIFFKNFMDARVKEVILPLAERVMDPAQAKRASAEGYLALVVMHEISHGLGPAFARRDGKQMDIREAIGATYSGLEEAKADVVGMLGLDWLIDHGVLSKDRRQEYYASYVAGIFRTVRFGTGEAHGRAEMMEFNYLSEQGAIVQQGDRYRADYAKIAPAIARLAKELLEQEATGDRARAEAWFAKYDKMPATLKSALDAAKDVPIDVDPTFSFPEVIE